MRRTIECGTGSSEAAWLVALTGAAAAAADTLDGDCARATAGAAVCDGANGRDDVGGDNDDDCDDIDDDDSGADVDDGNDDGTTGCDTKEPDG